MTRRVTIVVKTNQGGAWIVPHILELRRRGLEVTVIIPPGRGKLRTTLDALSVDVMDSAFDFSFRLSLWTIIGLFRLRKQISLVSPDLVFYHLYASALAVRLCTLGMGIPRVHMVAGPLYLESRWIRKIERILVRADTVLIGGSQHTENLYRQLGVSESSLEAIPYGVDTTVFGAGSPSERQSARRRLAIPSENFVAIMVAYVYAPKDLVHPGQGIKGHETILAAWRDFHARRPESTLMLVGAGFDEAGELHRNELRQRFDLDSMNVIWLDTVSDVRSAYWAADVSVSPSLSENHGAALEAGACSVPSIVSDAGGLPETVTGEFGWVFPRGDRDALLDALVSAYGAFQDGSLSTRSRQARDFVVAHFDSSVAAVRVANVVERLISNGSRGPERESHGAWMTFFSEARFGIDVMSKPAAMDEASAAGTWGPYSENLPSFRLAARLDKTVGSASRTLADTELFPLPYYVGLGSLLRSLPRTAVAIYRAISSSAVVLARLPGPIGFIAVTFGQFLRRPVFVEVVGDPYEVLRQSGSRFQRSIAGPIRLWMLWCVAQAQGVRYVTQHYLQSQYPPAQNASVVAISDVRLKSHDYSPVYARSSVTKWRLGAVGSQERDYKGHDIAIRALSMLREQGHDAELILVGHGAVQTYLRDLSQSQGVADFVQFVDAVQDRDGFKDFLDNLDIVLHPSRTEGLPRVILEAMARSRPVIATQVGGVPELIEEKWLVDKNDVVGLASRIREMMGMTVDELAAVGGRNFDVALRYGHEELVEKFRIFCRAIRAERCQ